MHAPLALLHLVISVGPFSKWGIDFVTINLVSSARHKYIIVAVDYFTKWAEALPTYQANGETVVLFLFNQDQSSSYYLQANGQVEAVNGVLKTMIHRLVGNHKTNWHQILYLVLWAYRTSVKTTTSFTPFQLAYGLEAILPIDCQIPSLQIAVELLPDTIAEEECLLYLNQLDETHRDAELALEAHNRRVKTQYDKKFKPLSY
eukprot:PITA_06407